MQNCPRLIVLLHRYIVHILSTGYRSISETPQNEPSVSGFRSNILLNVRRSCSSNFFRLQELELTTPVLEKSPSFEIRQLLLPVSQVWLLATTLPQMYIEPTIHHGSTYTAPTYFTKIVSRMLLGVIFCLYSISFVLRFPL